ncbi:MAG: cell wall biosynthesis glycosyltransferase [Phycisphaerae bacterium SM23_30]|nr:MAG: cell wall biosynthesis glycosyltransferase [Phycisphaerae bacterium SM23_30]
MSVVDTVVKELTVFFPFYNEQENIERLVKQAVEVLRRLSLDYEIILVNDGSRDRTGIIADRLARQNPRIKAVHHHPNRGYGAALQSGFRHAAKEWVFYTDGDGQFDLNQLELLLPLAGKYDIVNGYRLHRQDGLLRKINAAGWGWLVKKLLHFEARDVDSAFKLYRRKIFDHLPLKSTGALIDAEILARAKHAGYSLGQIGVRHLPRTAGAQTGSNIKVILRAFRELIKLRRDILVHPPPR